MQFHIAYSILKSAIRVSIKSQSHNQEVVIIQRNYCAELAILHIWLDNQQKLLN